MLQKLTIKYATFDNDRDYQNYIIIINHTRVLYNAENTNPNNLYDETQVSILKNVFPFYS